ncbi:glycosyltransferase family 4 protein [Candidatus Nomurabacteria bacterium]|nr:glycosyltransferase family 4 protein [Candidatus Kaiserbacteria bacterium]MCB9814288.1 glycosyltransferase family 4 protein [Candidatus Nomurabacteria bacterium]
MPKKILIFDLNYYPDHVGGAEVAVKEITDRIPPDEYEFHMVCLGYDSKLPKESQEGNVHVHRIGFTKSNVELEDLSKFPLHYNKHLYLFWAPIKGMLLHRKLKFNATWSMMAHPSGVPQAIFGLFYPQVTRILTLQEGDPPEYMERLYKPIWPLFKRVFIKADVIQVISHFLEKWARDMGYTKDIVFIPNGASTESAGARADEATLQALRESVGKQEGDVMLISVSRLVHKNAVDDVIKALALLPTNYKLLVVGGGEDEDKLKALAETEGVGKRVIFTGHVDRTMTAQYRQISDIFIRPSRSEGFGNSFASSMVLRLPVIATQEGGIADFLFDAKRNPDKETTGWAVDKDAPDQIAKAVEEILAHPEQVKQVTENAYQMVTTTYNWNHIAENMKEQVFDKILKNNFATKEIFTS